jgi:hypothetical protein
MQNRDGALSEAVAKQILARAAQLDASERMGVTVGDLRTAAAEAGISARALDRAFSEITSVRDAATTRKPARRSRLGMVLLAAMFLLIGVWVFGRTVAIEEPVLRPIPEVTPPR